MNWMRFAVWLIVSLVAVGCLLFALLALLAWLIGARTD